ncbi:MAG: hypothetical protein JWO42_4077 [Chloroflexi bacterium]|nr:hypothetical protein [Chloroflexota bacterium]
MERYDLVHLAQKVVSVGSVGIRCWIALMLGRDRADLLFLQVKEAVGAVLEPYAGTIEHANHRQRVADGQRLTQAIGNIFLGWNRFTGLDGIGSSPDDISGASSPPP